jgi:holliday junction DNA helicase RuvA
MIAYLNGTVSSLSLKFVILDVNGVGYQVNVTPKVLEKLDVGQEAKLFTYHHIREDGEELYGFLLADERDMFEKLLGVNGVGPKSALGVLARASVADIVRAVSAGETSLLTKVSGIGSKTAERIVLELAGKLEERFGVSNATGVSTISSNDADIIAALEQLGYSASEARKALSEVPSSITDVAARIKAVLRRSRIA